MLTTLTLTMTVILMFQPIATVKGQVLSTAVTTPRFSISFDAERIAVIPSGGAGVEVYDLQSAASTSFAIPAGVPFDFPPILYGNHVVIAASASIVGPVSIFYCALPLGALGACGPWTLITNTGISFSAFASTLPPSLDRT